MTNKRPRQLFVETSNLGRHFDADGVTPPGDQIRSEANCREWVVDEANIHIKKSKVFRRKGTHLAKSEHNGVDSVRAFGTNFRPDAAIYQDGDRFMALELNMLLMIGSSQNI